MGGMDDGLAQFGRGHRQNGDQMFLDALSEATVGLFGTFGIKVRAQGNDQAELRRRDKVERAEQTGKEDPAVPLRHLGEEFLGTLHPSA